MNDIESRVRAIVAKQLDISEEKVTLDAGFIDDLGADSLDVVELVMSLEDEFECEIPDEVAEKIKNLEGAVKYIQEKTVKVS